MKTEENKRMLALACTVADLKEENMELEQRVQQITAEYSNAVCQSGTQEKRKNEGSSTKTLVKLQQMQEQCDKLERESRELKRFAKAIHTFVKNNSIYMRKGTSCIYKQGNPAVCSTLCLECDSCLGVIEDHGVICGQRLKEANVFAGH